jgi:hypothetical protein
MDMRERVLGVGGEPAAGPAPGGGFRVTAWLPLRGCTLVISVLLTDDQAMVRSGLRALLDADDDIRVVGRRRTEHGRSSSRGGSIRTSWSWTSGCR